LDRTFLHVDAVMELLDIWMGTTYFQFGDKFYQQKNGQFSFSNC
jgi:hypothetical protein